MVLHCARASFPMHPLAPSDYTGGIYNVTIPANMTMATLSISTIKTDLVEADEDFKVTLSPPGSDSVVFGRDTAVVTIIDRTGEYAVYRLRWLLHSATCVQHTTAWMPSSCNVHGSRGYSMHLRLQLYFCCENKLL